MTKVGDIAVQFDVPVRTVLEKLEEFGQFAAGGNTEIGASSAQKARDMLKADGIAEVPEAVREHYDATDDRPEVDSWLSPGEYDSPEVETEPKYTLANGGKQGEKTKEYSLTEVIAGPDADGSGEPGDGEGEGEGEGQGQAPEEIVTRGIVRGWDEETRTAELLVEKGALRLGMGLSSQLQVAKVRLMRYVDPESGEDVLPYEVEVEPDNQDSLFVTGFDSSPGEIGSMFVGFDNEYQARFIFDARRVKHGDS